MTASSWISCSPSSSGALLSTCFLLLAQRLGNTAADLFCLVLAAICCQFHFWQYHLHHLLEDTRITPKDMESLVKNIALVPTVDEHRMQRPVKQGPVCDADRFNRFDGVENLARTNRQPRRAENAGEKGYCLPACQRHLQTAPGEREAASVVVPRRAAPWPFWPAIASSLRT